MGEGNKPLPDPYLIQTPLTSYILEEQILPMLFPPLSSRYSGQSAALLPDSININLMCMATLEGIHRHAQIWGSFNHLWSSYTLPKIGLNPSKQKKLNKFPHFLQPRSALVLCNLFRCVGIVVHCPQWLGRALLPNPGRGDCTL